LYLDMHNIQQ